MCGINGFIRLKEPKTYPQQWMRNLVHCMNQKIIHRGPDAEGLYADSFCALGMRRLSVIDPATGSQPVFNASRNKLIIFNGEIYNYKELRDELISKGCIFHTKSDTEVILLGIEQMGKDFVKRLEGMFAFCMYDSQKRKWLLARDRAGEKPLYYYQTAGFLVFASELKSLTATGAVPKEIDEEALTTYFQLGYIPAPMCILKGVKKLMPASVMEIYADGRVDTDTYWYLKTTQDDQYQDYEFCKKKLRETLSDSVSRRMISDVSLGAFLSGGFDSSIITGIMAQASAHPVETFTIGFKEKAYDESRMAELVSRKYGTRHHVFWLDWKEESKDIDLLLENIDEPFADPSMAASYAVSRMARDYVTVALTGDAGDELFAGYQKYLMFYYGNLYKKMPAILRKNAAKPLAERIPSSNSLSRKVRKVILNADAPAALRAKRMMCRAFQYHEVKKLLPGLNVSKMNFIKRQFYEADRNGTGLINDQKRTQYVDFKTVLEGQMLPKTDRAGMLASLETRVPMLDKHVTELAFQMPDRFKISRTNQKIILKDAFQDMLPDELYKMPKHGLDVPVGMWMDGALKKRMEKYTDAGFLHRQGLFDKRFIDGIIQKHKTLDIDWSTKVWSFFVFQSWYETYILGEA